MASITVRDYLTNTCLAAARIIARLANENWQTKNPILSYNRYNHFKLYIYLNSYRSLNLFVYKIFYILFSASPMQS
jgi:hypothetical protein